MVSKHLTDLMTPSKKIWMYFLILILTLVIAIGSTMAQDNPSPEKGFYFETFWIDIKAQDSTVPRVIPDSIAPYSDLGMSNNFQFGKTNQNGKLIYLETWDREFLEDLPLDTVVAGKPLDDYDVPIIGDDESTQKPVFFMKDKDSDEWVVVPHENTLGESRFIRLQWLKLITSSGELEKRAFLIQQSMEAIEEYLYNSDGSYMNKKVRLFKNGKVVDEYFVQNGKITRP